MAINLAVTSDKVQGQVNASLAANSFTATGWFRCSAITTDGNFNTVFNLLNGTSTGTIYFGSNSAGTGFRYRLGISGLVVEPSTTTEPFEANKWFFFAIRGNGTEAALFLAKEPNFTINKYTTTGSFTNASGFRAQLGANSPEGGAFAMRGAYSDFKVWSAPLSDEEIENIARRISPPVVTSFSNWYPLNRISLTDCYVDYGPTANNLIATSGTPTVVDGPPVSWGDATTSYPTSATINYSYFKPTSNITSQWTLFSLGLESSNLIARYLLNEASSGTSVTQINSTVNNYHLDEINYNSGAMFWTEDSGGNRGIRSSTTGQTQHARRKVTTGDPLLSASGGTKWTWEVVVDNNILGTANNERVVAIHRRTSTGVSAFSITVNTTEFFCTGFNNSSATSDGTALLHSMLRSSLTSGRNVIHLVIDSTLATAADRAKFYLNGAFMTPVFTNATVVQNSTLALNTDHDLIFFNRGDTGTFTRSPQGNLYYAALYNKALTTDEINVNYSALITNGDDTEGTGVIFNYEGVNDGDDEPAFSDYVYADRTNKLDEYKFSFPSEGFIKANSSLTISYTTEISGEAQANVSLYQGETLIKSTLVGTLGQSTGQLILTPAEAANITDVSNISLRITSV
jgi:hypothetical protein